MTSYNRLVGKSLYYVDVYYGSSYKRFPLTITSDGSDKNAGNGPYRLLNTQVDFE